MPAADIARIEAALRCIPPDLTREEWARVGMALKAELGEAGAELFRVWSEGGQSFNPRDVRDTWRSVSAEGGIRIGSLFELAKRHGWKPGRRTGPRASPAEREAEHARRAEIEAGTKAEREAKHAAAAKAAAELWGRAKAAPDAHPYLTGHGVKAGRLRAAGADLVVPMCDTRGQVFNVQRIRPDAAKRFLKGGRVSGLFYCAAGRPDAADVALLCEGVATAHAIAAALDGQEGIAVVAGFSAGNLLPAARAIRATWPRLRFVIAADDDASHHTDGRNPGLEAAHRAAAEVGGIVAVPAPLTGTQSDFADLAQNDPAAARAVLLAAVAAATQANTPAPAPKSRAQAVPLAPTAGAVVDDPLAIFTTNSRIEAAGYRLTSEGVFYSRRTARDSVELEWVKLCGPLKIEGQTRGADERGWGYLIVYADRAGRLRRWAMPARLLSGDGAEIRQRLLDDGLWLAPGQGSRQRLMDYLAHPAGEFVRTAERVGWCGASFLLPRETFSPPGAERALFAGELAGPDPFERRGTLAEWQAAIGAPAVGNSRLVLALCLAFAAPCLDLLGLESGGLHIVGDSGSGKTTALQVAGSVYGGEGFVLHWRATGNALENVAASRNDCALLLDEIAMIDAAEAGATVYALMSGQQKARLATSATLRAKLTWKMLLLSTGEVDFSDLMRDARQQTRAGQEVRLVSVRADAGRGLGVFEKIYQCASSREFAERLKEAAGRCYGTAGAAWLRCLVDERTHATRDLGAHVRELCETWASPEDGGQVGRVLRRFALLAAAGELASRWGIVPWPAGEAEAAARRVFEEWIAARGGRANSEARTMFRAAAGALQRGLGNFLYATRSADDHAARPAVLWGLRRLIAPGGEAIETDAQHGTAFGERVSAADAEQTSSDLLVLPNAWRDEICRGHDAKRAARLLFERGHLKAEDPDGKRLTRKERLPGIAADGARVYVIKPSLWADPWLADD